MACFGCLAYLLSAIAHSFRKDGSFCAPLWELSSCHVQHSGALRLHRIAQYAAAAATSLHLARSLAVPFGLKEIGGPKGANKVTPHALPTSAA